MSRLETFPQINTLPPTYQLHPEVISHQTLPVIAAFAQNSLRFAVVNLEALGAAPSPQNDDTSRDSFVGAA